MKRVGNLIIVFVLLASIIMPSTGGVFASSNLLINPGFETGDETGWYPYGEDHSIAVVSRSPKSGNYCAFVTGRTDSWNGIAQDMTDIVQLGKAYEVSAWVKVDAPGTHEVKISMKRVEGSADPDYDTISVVNMSGNVWTRLSGAYSISAPATLLEMYIEGPNAGIDFYVDDVELIEMYMNSENWRQISDERIEEIRKRDASIRIVDSNNRAVSGVSIEVNQTRNHFPFGSALTRHAMHDSRYTDFFKENFEWAVFENESKWYHNETSNGNVSYADADFMYNWCVENNITVRGHCIFWEVEEYVPSWVRSLSGTQLRSAMERRLESVVKHFKGKFVDWDVNNEMLHGSFFRDRLGDDIWLWMFNRTRELDPDAKLFVNDYNVISEAETDEFVQQIQWFLDNGVQIDGIGAQGHFPRDRVVDPVVVESRINTLGSLGIPVWITEYDSTAADVNLRADNLEKLYRIAFSNPHIEGILMWGFHANSHWRGQDAAIVDHDWTVNEAGKRYQALRKEWTTNDLGTTNNNGAYNFRGFHGTYDVKITAPGRAPIVTTIDLEPGAGTALYTFTLDGSQIPSVMYGDLNGDGLINSSDAVLLRRHILEIIELDSNAKKAADLNGDGVIDSTDFILLRRYILEIIPSLPVGQ
ncbi:UNVERIFIED_CONTAM: GH35 family endo-1,4-beta-xylanase [Acetivibrio alkalicellulosi]